MKRKKDLKKIKWENIVILIYIIITMYKYMICNNNIIILTIDLLLDGILGIIIYDIIKTIRKGVK